MKLLVLVAVLLAAVLTITACMAYLDALENDHEE